MEEKQVLAEIQKQERQLSTYWRSLHWHVCAVLAAGTAAAEILFGLGDRPIGGHRTDSGYPTVSSGRWYGAAGG